MATPEEETLREARRAIRQSERAEMLRQFIRDGGQWSRSLESIDELVSGMIAMRNKIINSDGTIAAHNDIEKTMRRLNRRLRLAFAALQLIDEDDINAFWIQVNDPGQRPPA